jgi:hypothetical protein
MVMHNRGLCYSVIVPLPVLTGSWIVETQLQSGPKLLSPLIKMSKNNANTELYCMLQYFIFVNYIMKEILFNV